MPTDRHYYKLMYQVCPIVLVGGIASQIPDGMLPVLNLMYQNYIQDDGKSHLRLPDNISDLDDVFGTFNILPGGTLIAQTIGKYPFANQWVAANAVIHEPLTVSAIMDAPMRGGGGGSSVDAWSVRQVIFMALKATLESHNNQGGLYTIATPAYMYENMVMTALTDNSRGNNSIPQNAWRWDFEKPLVVLSELQGAQNNTISKMSNKVPTNGQVSGPQPGTAVGNPPQSSSYPLIAALSGGAQPLFSPVSPSILNYPAITNPAGLPYSGIS
jgi:hypothetical protein